MDKVVFGLIEYNLLPSGYNYDKDNIIFYLFAEEIELNEVETTLLNISNVKTIHIKDENEHIIQTFRDYTVLKELKKIYDYSYETYINEEGDEIERKTDVIICELNKPDLRKKTEKNTADIEFIAIMEGIVL